MKPSPVSLHFMTTLWQHAPQRSLGLRLPPIPSDKVTFGLGKDDLSFRDTQSGARRMLKQWKDEVQEVQDRPDQVKGFYYISSDTPPNSITGFSTAKGSKFQLRLVTHPDTHNKAGGYFKLERINDMDPDNNGTWEAEYLAEKKEGVELRDLDYSLQYHRVTHAPKNRSFTNPIYLTDQPVLIKHTAIPLICRLRDRLIPSPVEE